MKNAQTVLITGASSGMGKDMANALIDLGYTVYAAARRIENMTEIGDKGGIPVKMDITNESDIETVIKIIKDNHDGVDILINNAGFGLYGAVEDTSIEEARYQFEVNLFGLASLTRKVLPYMRKNKSGKIINISSMGGKIYTPMGAWYHATKFALEGWSDCLRLELKPFDIDVILIEPGIIKTAFGTTLHDPLLKRSGNSEYSKMATAIAKATKKSYNSEAGSSPRVITNQIIKAINSKRPKTRYVAGAMAKPLIILRRILSDKMFDKIIMSQVK
ncbi:oxidoreductase [Mangrovivirga cuniculi]|uniref:Short-chain dehydrogenase/reductase n=1 Tax=Mangrovivirga cuniculi TaxID=2715131 RepID=A0A4D7JPF7_9BACT|nr:oxidoreductase [Mangrovivirga cuniculi]QCK16653.1 short-chain dehydrogenase/reductase [Mangrovivirga cuniculi]